MRLLLNPLTIAAIIAAPALGQVDPLAELGDPVAAVNAPHLAVREADRAETTLLPAIAAMEAPPTSLAPQETAQGTVTLHDRALWLTADNAGWDEAAAWLGSAPQQNALEVIRSLSEPESRFLWALPYGERDLTQEMLETGLAAKLIDGKMLAGMTFPYLERLDLLCALLLVEAERQAADGDGEGALSTLRSMIWLGRKLGDRSFQVEQSWGLGIINLTLDAARDLVYRYPDAFGEEVLINNIGALGENQLRLSRMTLPEGDRFAALQIVKEAFQRFGSADPARFGASMAAAESGNRPLLRFGRADWWKQVAESHAGYYETIDAINGVFDDWRLRWDLVEWIDRDGLDNTSDPLFEQPTHYETLDPQLYALVREIVPDLARIRAQRWSLIVRIAGTRTSFGVMGYYARNRNWPKPLFAIRPRYMRSLDIDPYDKTGLNPLQYFVPIRDQPRGPREAPRPHRITIILDAPDAGLTSVRLLLRETEKLATEQWNAVPESTRQSVVREFEQMLVNMARSGNSVMADANAPAAPIIANIATAMATSAGQVIPSNRIPPIRTRAAELIEEDDGFNDLITDLEGGARVDETTVRRFFSVVVRVSIRAAAEHLGIPDEVSTEDADAVIVDLDDSGFVLYSIGEDGRSDWARLVGPAGEDILLWPPLVSLARERLVERLETD